MCSAVLSLEEKAETAPEKSLKVTAAFGAESPLGMSGCLCTIALVTGTLPSTRKETLPGKHSLPSPGNSLRKMPQHLPGLLLVTA